MEKVIAVIVTYNRQQLLSECIAALRNQTRKPDKILVVNNGSTDATEKWLASQNNIEFITQQNSGSAGGFYEGIRYAYNSGYSRIWLMDDDGYPKQNALEKLLEDNTEELCLRNCAVINKEDKKSFVWKTAGFKTIDQVKEKVIKNVSHPFNGTLLHRKIVEKVGLPKPNLFLWGDESEYYHRIIGQYKIPFCTITESIHYHPASAYSYKNDWNYTSGWKMYYYVRNRFYVLQSRFCKNALLAAAMYIGFLIAFAGTIIVYQKTDKLKKLSFIFWPASDAFTKNFTASPVSILQRLEAKPSNRLSNYIHAQVKGFKGLLSGNTVPSLQKL